MSSLISTVGRYNEGLVKQEIIEGDYEQQQQIDDIDNIVVEDEEECVVKPSKHPNGPIIHSVHANILKPHDNKKPAAAFVDNYAS